MERPSIYDFAGGGPAFLALATATNQRCLADPVLSHPFSQGVDDDHNQHLADYWAEVFGGPAAYSAALGGHSHMLGIHANQGAEGDLGERFIRAFTESFDDAKLPVDPELRAALTAYMRWATDEVISYSPRDAVVPADLPVPRWTWSGLRDG